MNQSGRERDIQQACLLLDEYSFDLGGYLPTELVHFWQRDLEADPSWIRSAVVEALYQGRYKALSVAQILRVWKRRGHPLRHFNHEFERVVFGPVDATASKYAPLTTLPPSALLTPQADGLTAGKQGNSSLTTVPEAIVESHPAVASAVPKPMISAPVGDSQGASEIAADPVQPAVVASPENLLDSAEASPENLLDSAIATTDADPANAREPENSPPKPENLPTFIPITLPEIAAVSSKLKATPGETAPVQADSAAAFPSPEPIRKFVPQPQPSGFYARLQSVVRHL